MPGESSARVVAYAIAEPASPPGFEGPVPIEVNMLLLDDPEPQAHGAVAIGPGCRICPRADCAARREASILSAEP